MIVINNRHGWLVSCCTDVATKIAKSLTPIFGGWEVGDGKIEVKQGFVNLDRERCSKYVYFTIPYSNDSKMNRHVWLESCCTDVLTKIAKSLTPFRGLVKLDRERCRRKVYAII